MLTMKITSRRCHVACAFTVYKTSRFRLFPAVLITTLLRIICKPFRDQKFADIKTKIIDSFVLEKQSKLDRTLLSHTNSFQAFLSDILIGEQTSTTTVLRKICASKFLVFLINCVHPSQTLLSICNAV